MEQTDLRTHRTAACLAFADHMNRLLTHPHKTIAQKQKLTCIIDSMKTILPGTIAEPGLDRYKVGILEAPSGGAANMHTIKGKVAMITGAAGGIGQALATRRRAAGIA
jgi:FlaA1/EpsC-like NDP-sugar epimerase